MDFLGIELDATRNAGNAPVISTVSARVKAHVIPTNEELVIARAVCNVLGLTEKASAIPPIAGIEK